MAARRWESGSEGAVAITAQASGPNARPPCLGMVQESGAIQQMASPRERCGAESRAASASAGRAARRCPGGRSARRRARWSRRCSATCGLDRARRGARPRGAARRDEPLLRRDPRDDRTARRHGGEVHRRRGDGGVRDPAGARRTMRCGRCGRRPRSASGCRRSPSEVGVTLRFRTGVNTGLVLMGEGENLAIGDAVNVAARLEQAAAPGEIVLGGGDAASWFATRSRSEPLEPLALKGKSEPVPAFRLLAVDPAAPGVARHLDAPLVGPRARAAAPRRGLGADGRRSPAAICSRCWARPGWASRDWSRSCSSEVGERGDRAARPLPALRRGDHVLAAGRGADAAGRTRAEPVLEHLSGGGAATPEELFWEVAAAARGAGSRAARDPAHRRPAVGRADAARSARPRRRPVPRRADPAAVHGAPGAARGSARLGRRQAERHDGRCSSRSAPRSREALLDQLGDGLDAGRPGAA